MKNNMVVMFVIFVIVAAAAFYGGMQFEKSKTPAQGARGASSTANGNGARAGGRFGQKGNGGATRGQVVSLDANSITVKMQDGSSKIVLINGSTQVNKDQKASQSDIQNGDTVMAIGTANSDGSIIAQSIQINPIQGNFGRPDANSSPGQ